MAVEMRAQVPGMTKEMYDQSGEMLANLKTAPGFIVHLAGSSEGGYWVTEVWESQADSERWIHESVMPFMQKMGMTQPPQIQYLPADNVITR